MIRPMLFGVLAMCAIAVAACGKQVTPDPPNAGPGGLNPGYMSLKFDVVGQLDFTKYRYVFAFNTSGNGATPTTYPSQNNWAAYTFSVEVGGVNGGTFAQAFQFLHQSCCKTAKPAYLPLLTTPTQLWYVPNSNGTNSEFTVTFQPLIFSGVATPAPGTTAPPVEPVWQFNAFTVEPNTDAQLAFIDSLGTYGPTDTSFVSPNLNTKTKFDQIVYGLYDNTQMDTNAQIYSVEIANNPTTNPATPTPSPSP